MTPRPLDPLPDALGRLARALSLAALAVAWRYSTGKIAEPSTQRLLLDAMDEWYTPPSPESAP